MLMAAGTQAFTVSSRGRKAAERADDMSKPKVLRHLLSVAAAAALLSLAPRVAFAQG